MLEFEVNSSEKRILQWWVGLDSRKKVAIKVKASRENHINTSRKLNKLWGYFAALKMRLFLQFIFAICGFDYRAVGGGGSSLLVKKSRVSRVRRLQRLLVYRILGNNHHAPHTHPSKKSITEKNRQHIWIDDNEVRPELRSELREDDRESAVNVVTTVASQSSIDGTNNRTKE